MATIIDVAKEAGVSFKTVSRVLNDEPSVRPATRIKVLAAVDALGYRVNSAARALRSKEPRLIALVFDNTSRAYATDLQLGAMLGCRDAGVGLFVQTQTDAESLETLSQRTEVMGFLIGAPQADERRVIDHLAKAEKPIVRLATELSIPDSFHISVDERQASRDVARHLLDLGHRKIAFIGGPDGSNSAQLRREAFLAALEEAKVAVRPDWRLSGDFDFLSGLRIATEYLDATERPTAIFACNDDMAAGAIAAAYRLNLTLPQDLSIVGFDDSPIASVVYPALTTIRQTTQNMAETGVSLITEKRDPSDPPPTHIKADHRLILRESTTRPR